MASSENVASMMEPWAFRPTTFADSWISEAFARDTKTLTRALQKSLTNNPEQPLDSSDDAAFFPFLNDLIRTETAPTPTVSGLSGSDDLDAPAAAQPKRQQRSAIPVAAGGKASKRKSRASKRSQTTFITADPSNFRQMVQQVTGVRFGGGPINLPEILKPEPQRAVARFPGGSCGMPTLDTSAALLDRHNQQQQQMVAPAMTSVGGFSATLTGPGPVSFGPTSGGADVASGGGVGAGGLGFESFSSFPTLESWKVM